MAYNSSGALSTDQRSYTLGKYTFWLSAQYNESADATTCIVICTVGGQQATRRQPVTGQVTGWYVEANETEASVYVKTKNNVQPLDTSPVSKPIPQTNSVERYSGTPSWPYAQEVYNILSSGFVYRPTAGGKKVCFVLASSTPMEPAMVEKRYNAITGIPSGEFYYNIPSTTKMTHNGKTVYYSTVNDITAWDDPRTTPIDYYAIPDNHIPNIAWTMIYGEEIGKEAESLIGRFAIDIREADGGPDGGWDEPGDAGDPSYTLNVSVTGASSGSNSGIPLEAQEQSGYGSGGYGGNGGGGGAGASTVIVRQFATNKANSKDITALAKRHGYGSGGGKGGNGGDGCILIYY